MFNMNKNSFFPQKAGNIKVYPQVVLLQYNQKRLPKQSYMCLDSFKQSKQFP